MVGQSNVLGTLRPYSQPSFSSFIWNRGGVRMCKLGVISQERLKLEVKLSANRKSYMPRRLAQQRITSTASRAVSAVAEPLV